VRAPLYSHSRSTSSGSLTTVNTDEDAVSASSSAKRGSPRSWDDEAVVAIKNTFINLALSRQPSLDGFFEERMNQSCPATRCPSPERSDSDSELLGQQESSPQHQQQQQQQQQPLSALPVDDLSSDWQESEAALTPVTQVDHQSRRQVLCLGDMLWQPELGSREFPTVGSSNHRLGTCKPCAFAHTKGCENGTSCQFCHLCEPGEKKRRQKRRLAAVVAASVVGQTSPVHVEESPHHVAQQQMSAPSLVHQAAGNWQGGFHMAAVFGLM